MVTIKESDLDFLNKNLKNIYDAILKSYRINNNLNSKILNSGKEIMNEWEKLKKSLNDNVELYGLDGFSLDDDYRKRLNRINKELIEIINLLSQFYNDLNKDDEEKMKQHLLIYIERVKLDVDKIIYNGNLNLVNY